MIKRYKTKVIGSGTTPEDAIRPEFLESSEIDCIVIDDYGDGNVLAEVDGDESIHKFVLSYPNTTEEHS